MSATTTPTPASNPVVDVALIGIVGVAASFAAVGVLTVEAADAFTLRRRPPLSVQGVLTGMAGWPQHLADPRTGFPNPLRDRLPGPVAMWAGLVAAVIAVAVCVAAVVWLARWKPAGVRHDAGGWATPAEMRELAVKHPTPGRITLGAAGRLVLACEQRASLLIIGPTQCGKTESLAAPALREWPGPVMATSVKRDLVNLTVASRPGPTRIFDPSDPNSAGWNPLVGCDDWRHAERVAGWFVKAIGSNSDDFRTHWGPLATKVIAPAMFAAATSPVTLTMADVLSWVDRHAFVEVADLLDTAKADGRLGAAKAAEMWHATRNRDDRLLSNVMSTVEAVLACFGDPVVAEITARSDIIPAEVIAAGTLYLVAPIHEQERLRPLFVALVEAVLVAAYASPTPLDPPLLLVLDEAANVAPIPDLEQLASTAAGLGVQLVTVFQNLAQCDKTYGPDGTRTIISNHKALLALSGLKDAVTLRLLSELVGDHDVERVSQTRGSDGRGSTATALEHRPAAPVDQLRRMPRFTGMLIYGAHRPARLKLRKASAQATNPVER